jgi:glycerol-3-phosphate dehydrogenase subunit B
VSRHDAIVIGVGLAGLTAATRLAQAGANVLVLAKGVGSTHLSGGTIDVLGYDPERVERPAEALERLVAARPDHPYRLVGAAGVADAVEWFVERFAEGPLAPYAYTGGVTENLLLTTAAGAPRPSALVPETMAAGDLRGGLEVCVAGFRALKDFHASLLADNLGRVPGVSARGIELDLSPEGRADVNALGFARAFDQPAFRAEVVAKLRGKLGRSERVAFPAVLGLTAPHAVWADVSERLERPVFEVPTLPPSVPGMRVFATLREVLRRAGGRVILNAVVGGVEVSGGRVTAVRARAGLREAVHHADWVVLASGGFAAGGLELNSRWEAREVALGLPVAGIEGAGGERFRADYFGEQPAARAGIAVDLQQRPVDAAGERIHDNVLVAGAALAGAEPWREKSGDGLSLSTGHRAAGLILEATGARSDAPAAAAKG